MRKFLSYYLKQIGAYDLLHRLAALVNIINVLFFIQLGTRRVLIFGDTEHPTSNWLMQQARQHCWGFDDSTQIFRYLLPDRYAKFTTAFDQVFCRTNIEVIHTPIHAPSAHAYVERWVREAYLDQLLILNNAYPKYVVHGHYLNTLRFHQALDRNFPIRRWKFGPPDRSNGVIWVGDVLHNYYRAAGPPEAATERRFLPR